jgi:hypothetical protein
MVGAAVAVDGVVVLTADLPLFNVDFFFGSLDFSAVDSLFVAGFLSGGSFFWAALEEATEFHFKSVVVVVFGSTAS